MSTPIHVVGMLVLAMGLSEPVASAQESFDWNDQIPAHAAVVDGPATLERDGVIETLALNTILIAGDRLRTDQGRVEVLFSDGSVLDIDAFSSVDVLSDTLFRLLDGRVRLTVARTAGAGYRVDSAGGSAVIRMAGEYRIAIGDTRYANPQMEVVVYRGSAELGNRLGTTIVRAGTYAVASASTPPSLPFVVNSAAWDQFDMWSNEQRDARLGYTSAQYLPAELRSYGGVLDREGSWDYVSGYGNVWYPYVDGGWYPYSQGSWSVVGSFGWTWVGANRWSWPTHHYGRWGHVGGRWCWIPGNQWAPAWVSWVSSPGYVGWSPLGFDNRPLVSITTVVNVGPRLGWSVVPRAYWKPRVHVGGVIVPHDRVRPELWTQFADHRGGPDYAGPPAARGGPPPAGAPPNAGRAVPRGTARPAITTPAPAPRSRVPSRPAAGTQNRPTIRAAAPPVRATPRETFSAATPQARTAAPRPVRPSGASNAVTATPRSGPPDVVYYRGRSTQAPASAAPTPNRSRSVIRSAPPATPPSARATRPSPGAQPSRSMSTARPRMTAPASPPRASRPSSSGSGTRAAPSRPAGPPPPSAQPNRGGGRGAPAGAPSRGAARPRGGGGR